LSTFASSVESVLGMWLRVYLRNFRLGVVYRTWQQYVRA